MTRKRNQNPISLFPFLAVLVCAMGALILLLLVMTRKIRHEQAIDLPDPVSVVVAPAAILPPDRSDELMALQTQRQLVAEDLLRLQQEIDSLQLAVSQQEAELRTLREQMVAMEQDLKSAEKIPDASNADELQKQIAQLRSQLAALQRRLNEQEKQLAAKQQQLVAAKEQVAATQQKLVAVNSAILMLRKQIETAEQSAPSAGAETVVDFSNTTGTTRTPIMVEVTKDGYTFLPDGIKIHGKDMEGFPTSDTPLLAAILAVHRERSKGSVTSNPYVLLLVRPSGSEAFYPAQGILSNEKIHFGYELIADDQKIAAGESSETEVRAAEVAVQEAYQRRDKVYANLRMLAQTLGPGGAGTGLDGTRRAADPTTRGLSFRADGTVGSDSRITTRGTSSRNFAGGVTPPPGFYEKRAAANLMHEKQRAVNETSPPSDQFAEHYARSGATVQKQGQETATSDRQFSQATAPTDSRLSSGSGSPNIPDTGRPDNHVSQGNTGRPMVPESPEPLAAIGSTERAERILFNNHATPPVVSQKSSAGVTGSGGARNSGGEGESQLTAEEHFASMMAGQNVLDPQSVPSRHLHRPSEASSNNGTALSAEPVPGEPTSPMLDLSRVDKDLLARLPSTKKTSKSYATPVGITVFLDEHHMTVGQHPAIAVDSETLNRALVDLLRDIDTEVTDVKKSPREEVMPIVKFIVSPGGERWRIPLNGSLKHLGIPSATVYELSPHIEMVAAPGRATY